jgi:surface polysaccharide O-acyltransferase-like enzyme
MELVETARRLAGTTPDERNRAVDLFRAASILVVVWGHWTMAAVTVEDGELVPGHILVLAEWTHPLTWVLQVMPVFFLVGGYANGLSWRSARTRGTTYGGWMRARARRLTLPVVPVLVAWFALGWVALRLGMDPGTLRLASTVALVPTWFLACYILVVALAPLSLLAWERWGWWSVGAGILLAALVDVVSLRWGSVTFGFANYLVVWATVHQVGLAWLDGKLASRRRRWLLAVLGLAGLLLLATMGPYPVSMVGVDTATVNNTYPPRVTLVFLGLFQAGVVLLFEAAAQRLARVDGVWTAVVAVNARIMTLYLWHVTAMVAVIGVSLSVDGVGLGVEPLTLVWWLTRPGWYVVLALVTVALAAGVGRFETPGTDDRPAPPSWRPLLAVAAVCAGLGALAVLGIVDGDGDLRGGLLALPLLGLLAGGVLRPPRASSPPRGPGLGQAAVMRP